MFTRSSVVANAWLILTLFLRAATRDGWMWQCRDGAGNPTNRIVFRLGPGRLASGSFTHVLLTKHGKMDLEAHIGVKVSGKAPYVVTLGKKSANVSDVITCQTSCGQWLAGRNPLPSRT